MPESQSDTHHTDAPTDSETIRALLNRRSIRKYTDEPLAEKTVEAILRAAFRSPTSSNIQSYSIIIVREQDTKDRLCELTNGQTHVAATSVFLAFCADLSRIAHAVQKEGFSMDDNNLELGLVASIDVALVGMSAYIAAESLGIQGLMIGAVRNKPEEVAQLLGLPPQVYCVFGMCLGWPAEAPPQKPRMAYENIVHYERYEAGGTGHAVTDYDKKLANHYRSMGKITTDDSWSHDIGIKLGNRPRDTLRQVLKGRGIDWT